MVVWQNCDAKYEWFLAYVKDIDYNEYTTDHLHCTANNWWQFRLQVEVPKHRRCPISRTEPNCTLQCRRTLGYCTR